MATSLAIALFLAALLCVGIANAWLAPKLLPVAGRARLRLVHVVVISAPVVAVLVLLVVASAFPASMLGLVARDPALVVAVGVVALAVAALAVFALEKRAAGSRADGI